MDKVKNELCPKIMLDLFKEPTHSYNLRNSLICGSCKIKTVRYGTETIPTLAPNTYLGLNYSKRNKRICIIRNIPSKDQVLKPLKICSF